MHRDGSTPKKVKASRVLVTSITRGSGIGTVGSQSRSGARSALRDGGGAKETASPEVLTMPLKRGKSPNAIARNIGTLIGEGYPRDQAAAISYEYSRRSNKGKKK